MRPELDQLREGLRDLAQLQRTYYQDLLDAGMGQTEALELAKHFVATLLRLTWGREE